MSLYTEYLFPCCGSLNTELLFINGMA